MNDVDEQRTLNDEDYTCPICLELLLRPVVLSCHVNHRFCRGCWARVLQSRDVRATARLTGGAACPYRCEVKPVVPEVDQTLASQLESLFARRYKERASSTSLPDEERRVTEVNEWAAHGCKLHCTQGDELHSELATVQAARTQERAEERLHTAFIIVSVAGATLLTMLLSLMLMKICYQWLASHPGTMRVLFALTGLSAAFVLLDALLVWRMMQLGVLAVTPARIATPPAEGDPLPARHFVCGRLLSRINMLLRSATRALASSSTSARALIHATVHRPPQEHVPSQPSPQPQRLSEIAIAL